MKKERSFLGQGWAFPPGFSLESRTVLTVSDEEDILQSLIILLSTELGERIMHPRYGCDLHSVVFEKADKTTITYLQDTIETAIIYHEPRIELLHIEVSEGVDQEGRIIFDISYVIRATNTRSNLVFPYYLSEATDFLLQ